MDKLNHSIIQSILLSTPIYNILIEQNQTSPSPATVKNVSDDGKFSFPGKASPYSMVEAVVIASILLCIIIGTIIGNVLVCVAVCLVKKLRRPCNYLLVSLAISDICVAVLVMPMATLYEILGKWTFGPVVCDLWVSFDVLSCTASILNLCMISVDRYYAITKPLQYGVKRTPRRMLMCVGLVWLVAACISLPPLLILGNKHDRNECMVSQNFGYQIYATLGSFYIPLSVMIFVYYKIFRAARRIIMDEKHSRSHLEAHCCLDTNPRNGLNQPVTTAPVSESFTLDMPPIEPSTGVAETSFNEYTSVTMPPDLGGDTVIQMPPDFDGRRLIQMPPPPRDTFTYSRSSLENPQPSTSRKKTTANLAGNPSQKRIKFHLAKERKASTTLGIIMSAFTVCWLPFFVLALVRPFINMETAILRSLSSLFLWLGYANSLLNPIIYATLNRDFRKPFQQILYFKCSSLNDMMREEFYQSQYGDPHYTVVHHSNLNNPNRLEDPFPSRPTHNESFL